MQQRAESSQTEKVRMGEEGEGADRAVLADQGRRKLRRRTEEVVSTAASPSKGEHSDL
jgi:hypothetical protein